jgi:23S rRNA (cytidine1920-2'-O)/16S rRNA (cytidine1409-2'-O)-methyltransferase
MKERVDTLLVERGLVESRAKAQALIMAGEVRANGEVVRKAGEKISTDAVLEVKQELPYVSRGGYKLAGALDEFGVNPEGKICADVGASTGGFTDVLLQRGAAKVYAIDVGQGILAWKLRNDPRVVVMERTNARHLTTLDEPIELAVMDASFISIELLLPAIAGWLVADGDVVTLVKPQFEAGREAVGKGGVVRESKIHQEVLERTIAYAQANGWGVRGVTVSPITGPAGNKEFFLWLTLGIAAPYDVEWAIQTALTKDVQ